MVPPRRSRSTLLAVFAVVAFWLAGLASGTGLVSGAGLASGVGLAPGAGTTFKPPSPPPGLDAEAARIMKAFEVPGLALAIVKDGQVIVAKGYGVRKLGDPAPVDARTLFGIASNTKVFTATALGLLVEEGKLAWDAPVISYLPWFQMYDPYVTRELTVRDLLVHRSGLGLGAGDLLFWPPSTYNRKEIVRAPALHQAGDVVPSAYAYDNLLYSVAGEVIEAVSGKAWEDFVSERILAKVGMTWTQRPPFRLGRGRQCRDHARRGRRRRPARQALDERQHEPGRAASTPAPRTWRSGCWSCSAAGSSPDGTRLFSERTYRELTTLVTPMPNPAPAARARGPEGRTSTATPWASTSRTTAAYKVVTPHRRAGGLCFPGLARPRA